MSFETDAIPIRVCPSCGSEFQPHVMECLDCGTATVSGWEGMTEGLVRSGKDAPMRWSSDEAAEEPERGAGLPRVPRSWGWSPREEGDPRGLDGDGVAIRACPSCGSEFQLHVLQCLDCGEATVPAWEGAEEEEDGAESHDDPAWHPPANSATQPPSQGVALRAGDGAYIKPLLESLAQAKIEAKIIPRNVRFTDLMVVVREEDAERAREIERKVYLRQMPDLPSDAGFTTTDVCPACGARVRSTTTECPECGLAIETVDEVEGGEADG